MNDEVNHAVACEMRRQEFKKNIVFKFKQISSFHMCQWEHSLALTNVFKELQSKKGLIFQNPNIIK